MVTGRSRPTVGSVQPSSLIFLVIVAIWAAYLIQHWVRRREHVATARSVDRFSEAMRVLERRSPLPSSELSAPRPHSYAVRPGSSRPAIGGKRASAASAASSASSLAAQVTARVGQRLSPRSPLTARSSGSSGSAGSQDSIASRAPRSAAEIAVRKIRGVAFLVTLAAIPVTLLLSVIHVLPWVSVLIAFLACAAAVAWLRTSALREQAARRSAATRSRAPRAATPRTSGRDTALRTGGSSVFDVNAPASPDEVAVVAEQISTPGQSSAPGAWSPVPVPLPTYALKNAAARALPEPADVTQMPVPIEVEDDDIERMAARHHRRVVGS